MKRLPIAVAIVCALIGWFVVSQHRAKNAAQADVANLLAHIRVGDRCDYVDLAAQANGFWRYDLFHGPYNVLYRSTSWMEFPGTAKSYNVPVSCDARAHVTAIGEPKAYITAAM